MLKIVIGTNEGKVLCISNNEDEIKASMVNYLIDTDQEPTEDFFESRNWGEYDIEVYEYHQPQLNENQEIVLDYLKGIAVKNDNAPIVTFSAFGWQHFGAELPKNVEQAYRLMDGKQDLAVMSAYVNWGKEQEAE